MTTIMKGYGENKASALQMLESQKAEEKDENDGAIRPEAPGPHSAHCEGCGFGFSKMSKANHPHSKAIHHAMSKGHVVHVIHHSSGRAVRIEPRGHVMGTTPLRY